MWQRSTIPSWKRNGGPETAYLYCRTSHTQNVRFFDHFVRFTPVNGHYSGWGFRPLLTHNGHHLPNLPDYS